MNTLRKLSIFALVVIIIAVGFAPADNAAAQDTTLVVWHAWQDAEADLFDAWVAAYPGDVSIEARYLPFDDLRAAYETAAATGEGPDLLIGAADWAGGFNDSGIALALNEEIAGTQLEANLSEAAWDLMGFEGTRYGVPVTLDGVALYYNRDFIDDDEVPATFEEMLELGVELTEGEDVGLIFPNGFYHTAGIYFGLGGQLFDAESNNLWNTDEAAVGYLELHQMVAEASDQIYNGESSLFQEGRAAMIVDGSWQLGTYTEALGEDRLGLAVLPDVGEDMPWRPFFGGKGFYVNAGTENVEAALDFLTFVTSPESLAMGAEIAGHIPPVAGVEVENPAIGVFAEQFSVGVALPTSPAMNSYWGPCQDAIAGVTERDEAPEDAAAAAEAVIVEALGATE